MLEVVVHTMRTEEQSRQRVLKNRARVFSWIEIVEIRHRSVFGHLADPAHERADKNHGCNPHEIQPLA